MVLSCECMFLDSLSRHNRDLEWRTWKPPQRVTALRSWIDRGIALRSWVDHVIVLRQISIIAVFHLEDRRRIYPQIMRACHPKKQRGESGGGGGQGRKRFGSSPWACPMQIGLSQVRCFLYLRSSLWSLDLPLFYFRGLFSSLSFSHCHFGLLFPILTT